MTGSAYVQLFRSGMQVVLCSLVEKWPQCSSYYFDVKNLIKREAAHITVFLCHTQIHTDRFNLDLALSTDVV